MRAAARGFWPLRDLPVVLWLLSAVVVAAAHPVPAAPRWLLIHLTLLGAATHAILVWSRHFADALLHLQPGSRPQQSARLLLLDLGVLAVLVGVVRAVEPMTVTGAAAVSAAVLWHGGELAVQLHRSLPSRFAATTHYYVAAAALLPLGAALGVAMAHGLGDPQQEQVVLAHVTLNVLGWIGLTVVGTLVTLWPTMLRTQIDHRAEAAARRALPVLVGAILVTAAGALAGQRQIAAAGLLSYLAGLSLVAAPFVRTARRKLPLSFPTWSMAAGVAWWAGSVAAMAVGVATASSWAAVGPRLDAMTPYLAAGFALQALLGALSYLVPMVLGGGPGPVRAATAVVERGGALRVAAANAGLLGCALPLPSLARVLSSVVVLLAFAAFLPLLLLAMGASRRARRAPLSCALSA